MNIKRMPKITTTVFAGGTTLLVAGAAVAATLSPSGARMLHMADAPRVSAAAAVATTATPVRSSSSPTSPVPTSKTPSVNTAKPKVKVRASAPHVSTRATAATKAPITYTVRRGDTLTGISTWFKLHGYGSLYAANAKVIGANPNLIHPGERITIGSHVMKVQGPA